MRYRKLTGFIVLCLATAALAQEPRNNTGVLTCTLGDAEGPGRNMTCGFKPSGDGGEERYVGTLRSRDRGPPAGKLVLVWSITAPASMKMSPGALAQRFTKGRSAIDQPPTLVGEKDSSIVLQFETNNGIQAIDAITEVELKLTTTPA